MLLLSGYLGLVGTAECSSVGFGGYFWERLFCFNQTLLQSCCHSNSGQN